jgi:flagellar basal-body rod modification protein FlgD
MTPIAAVTGSSTKPQTAQDVTDATQERFLKLLMAQMRNQDPLNPLDNTQVTSQLAQLSTVTGINKLSELMQGLTNSYAQTQSLQATNLIGRGVLTEGSSMILSQGAGLAGFELASAADQVVIQVKDSGGNVIHATNLGAQNAGTSVFQWDGVRDDGTKAPDGVYRFEVSALANGQAVAATRLSHGTVASVSLNGSEAQLNLLNLGAVTLAQIKQVM